LGCTVQELGARMSAEEFGEWWALYCHEPWGEVRSDIAAGVITAMLFNINRREHTRPAGPLDFAPYLKPREEEREVSIAQMVEEARRGRR
jgi:hypothetical protein